MVGQRIVFPAERQAALEPYDVPSPRPGEVLLENSYTILSAGTERANLLGLPNTSGSFPHYPGYCGVGHIVAVGDGVTNVRVGDRVLARSSGHRSHPIQRASRLAIVEDDGIGDLDASPIVIAAMGLQGVRKSRLELGESVMVLGLGLLGLFAVQAAKLGGGIPVVVADFEPGRRALARTLGADHAFSPDEPDLPAKVRELTGGGVNAVVEVTGAAAALQLALDCVAREGRIALTGCTRISDTPIDFYRQVHVPGVSLIGAHNQVRPAAESRPGYWTELDDYRALLRLLAAGRLQTRPLISEVVSPAAAPEVYGRLAADPLAPLGIAFDWGQVRTS